MIYIGILKYRLKVKEGTQNGMGILVGKTVFNLRSKSSECCRITNSRTTWAT